MVCQFDRSFSGAGECFLIDISQVPDNFLTKTLICVINGALVSQGLSKIVGVN